MANNAKLPPLVTPAELAKHLGVSERTVREKARELGACRTIGKKTLMTECDVTMLMEAIRVCPTNSTSGARSGTSASPSPVGDFGELLALRKKSLPSGSQQRPKRGNGTDISMGRPRM